MRESSVTKKRSFTKRDLHPRISELLLSMKTQNQHKNQKILQPPQFKYRRKYLGLELR